MLYFTYILFSELMNRYYVGSTQNVIKRVSEHNTGKTRSTKSGEPWQIVALFENESRSEAIMLENKIKKRGIKRFLLDNKLKTTLA
jgi:putative endonuclease